MSDNVNHPQHYNMGGIEIIDMIEAALVAKFGQDGFAAYCEGNIIKYRMRAPHKGGAEDIAKSMVYEEWAKAGTAKVRNVTPLPVIDIDHPTTASAARIAQQNEEADAANVLNVGGNGGLEG